MKFFPLVTAGNCATWPKQIVRFFIASPLADRRDARFFWLRFSHQTIGKAFVRGKADITRTSLDVRF